jgi:UDP:flavonoid glycosyltransferase YjiC (YdhE family)
MGQSVDDFSANMHEKLRILFIAEAVTLAHVARLLALAQSLDRSRYEICFACDPRYNSLIGKPDFTMLNIKSIPGERFFAALSKGSPIYETDTLDGYVKEDIQLIRDFKPALIVGDFRLSLSVSARITAIPYATITNAYWSPYAKIRYPVPEIPLTRAVGVPLAQLLFDFSRPLVFAIHSLPLNRLRRRYGLPNLKFDLRHAYTEADYTLYADLPDLVPTSTMPAHHAFIGPILWSPEVTQPSWWTMLPSDKPIVYLTLGSSGQRSLLPVIFQALSELPVSVIAATAGQSAPTEVPANVFVADFLPGSAAAARSKLVICNGGSPTCYQALDAGAPVLGIASNLDQYLNMTMVQDAGTGTLIRAGQATAALVRDSVTDLLASESARKNAEKLKLAIALCSAKERFAAFIEKIFEHG